MTQGDVKDYLQDILDASYAASNFVAGMTFDSFETDQKTIFAVTRAIEIIGEATKSIPENIRLQYLEVPWKNMAGMRDKVIHQYFGVNYQVLWDTVQQDIPWLREKVRAILEDLKQN